MPGNRGVARQVDDLRVRGKRDRCVARTALILSPSTRTTPFGMTWPGESTTARNFSALTWAPAFGASEREGEEGEESTGHALTSCGARHRVKARTGVDPRRTSDVASTGAHDKANRSATRVASVTLHGLVLRGTDDARGSVRRGSHARVACAHVGAAATVELVLARHGAERVSGARRDDARRVRDGGRTARGRRSARTDSTT